MTDTTAIYDSLIKLREQIKAMRETFEEFEEAIYGVLLEGEEEEEETTTLPAVEQPPSKPSELDVLMKGHAMANLYCSEAVCPFCGALNRVIHLEVYDTPARVDKACGHAVSYWQKGLTLTIKFSQIERQGAIKRENGDARIDS